MDQEGTTPDPLYDLVAQFNENKNDLLGKAALLFFQFASLNSKVDGLVIQVARMEKGLARIQHQLRTLTR